MSKAILVMDMPKSCDVCDFVTVDEKVGNMTCTNPLSAEYGCDVTDYIGCRAANCPLQYVPKKQPHYPIDETFMRGAKTGYNACIDDILKGSEENE